jgi:hypothetical protein
MCLLRRRKYILGWCTHFLLKELQYWGIVFEATQSNYSYCKKKGNLDKIQAYNKQTLVRFEVLLIFRDMLLHSLVDMYESFVGKQKGG